MRTALYRALFAVVLLPVFNASADVIIRGGNKGTTTESPITSTACGTNNQCVDTIARDASGNAVTTTDIGGGKRGLDINTALNLDPTNLATGAKQDTANTALAAIKTALDADHTGGNPCVNPSATLVSATGATTGIAAVEFIPLSSSKKIYLCSLTVIGVSGTDAPTFSLVQGTGTACATGPATLVSPWPVGTALWAFAGPVAVSGAGKAICYLQTGTTPVANYQLTYVQQ